MVTGKNLERLASALPHVHIDVVRDMARKAGNIVDSGKMKLTFTLFPATVEQIVKVADAEEVMPPKSTWVEPKFRSGLVVYDLSRI